MAGTTLLFCAVCVAVAEKSTIVGCGGDGRVVLLEMDSSESERLRFSIPSIFKSRTVRDALREMPCVQADGEDCVIRESLSKRWKVEVV